jgi:putative iron-dependent peroxidase
MAIAALRPVAAVADETSSWPYRHDLDLTGFIDGTENPTLIDAPELVLISDHAPDSRSAARHSPARHDQLLARP